jgi:hypothetical protein
LKSASSHGNGNHQDQATAADLDGHHRQAQPFVSATGPHCRPYDDYVGTLGTALVDSGIATIVDDFHNSRTPEHSGAAVQALIEDSNGLPRRCHRHS